MDLGARRNCLQPLSGVHPPKQDAPHSTAFRPGPPLPSVTQPRPGERTGQPGGDRALLGPALAPPSRRLPSTMTGCVGLYSGWDERPGSDRLSTGSGAVASGPWGHSGSLFCPEPRPGQAATLLGTDHGPVALSSLHTVPDVAGALLSAQSPLGFGTWGASTSHSREELRSRRKAQGGAGDPRVTYRTPVALPRKS